MYYIDLSVGGVVGVVFGVFSNQAKSLEKSRRANNYDNFF